MQATEYEVRKQIKELQAAILAEPHSYFVESWKAAIAEMEVQAKALNASEREALKGKEYNTLLDDWVERKPVRQAKYYIYEGSPESRDETRAFSRKDEAIDYARRQIDYKNACGEHWVAHVMLRKDCSFIYTAATVRYYESTQDEMNTVITFNTKTGKYHAFQGKRFVGAYDTMLEAGQALLKRGGDGCPVVYHPSIKPPEPDRFPHC